MAGDGDEDQIARLTALLVHQSEMASRRDERLAAMLERALTQERTPPTAPTGGASSSSADSSASSGAAAGAPGRLPPGAITAPHLSSSASLKEFGAWRQKFQDYQLLAHLDSLPANEQKAALMSLLDDEWSRTLRYSIRLEPDGKIKDILDAMETYLRGQRSIVLDRREFYSRVQEPGESFDDFVCAIKEIAAYCDFCETCLDDQYRDRIVAGVHDEEAIKRMLQEKELTLQTAVDICRACESANVNSAALRGEPVTVGRMSAYRQQRRADVCSRSASGQNSKCPRCGRRRHSDRERCPAVNAVCSTCGGTGHFAATCPSEWPATDTAHGRENRPDRRAGRGVRSRGRDTSGERRPPGNGSRSAHSDRRSEGSDHTSVRQMVVADVSVERIQARPTPTIDVMLRHAAGEMTVTCTPDTGAEATVMGAAMAASVGVTADRISPASGSAQFTSVSRAPLTCKGLFEATVTLGDCNIDTTVYVLEELRGFLLGWTDIVRLRILPANFPTQIPAHIAECRAGADSAAGQSTDTAVRRRGRSSSQAGSPAHQLTPSAQDRPTADGGTPRPDGPAAPPATSVQLTDHPIPVWEHRHDPPGEVIRDHKTALRRGEASDAVHTAVIAALGVAGEDGAQIAPLRDTVSACPSCRQRAPRHCNEPLWQDTELPSRVFESVSADYFHVAGRTYLVYADRLSGWPYVTVCPRTASADHLTRQLRTLFAQTGVPVVLHTDGGPQFASSTVRRFLERWGVRHEMSSPRYPRSNGHAESAVKTVKKLVVAASSRGSLDEDQLDRGLLEIRNAPRQDGRSPAQVLFGHPLRPGSVPTHHRAYAAEWQKAADQCDRKGAEIQQDVRRRHDSRARSLSGLHIGCRVDVQNTESGRWDRTGLVVGIGQRRSYLIKMPSGRIYWRNRRFLRPHHPMLPNGVRPAPPSPVSSAETGADQPLSPSPPPPPAPRRSGRHTRPPQRLTVQWHRSTYAE